MSIFLLFFFRPETGLASVKNPCSVSTTPVYSAIQLWKALGRRRCVTVNKQIA